MDDGNKMLQCTPVRKITNKFASNNNNNAFYKYLEALGTGVMYGFLWGANCYTYAKKAADHYSSLSLLKLVSTDCRLQIQSASFC